MRDAMLILHFIGLAMGVGTSIGFMFLGMASAKMEKSEALKFTVNSFALSKMGQIGLVLLVLSGGYLMTPYWKTLPQMPLLITKLVLVLVLGALVGIISSKARKAKTGDTEAELKKIAPFGRISLLVGLAIVILAVLIFH
ncbi:MAG: hypothetical protein IPJ74_24690 [Saprospiraceae bacterium]|nr:hypothetical protein [Saprospiraceae bacterium]